MNANTYNKPSTSFYHKHVVHQMIFSTHCNVINMTYDMRDLTCFLTFEVNIMRFLLLGSWQGLGVSLNTHISVMKYLLVLPLLRKGSNKLRGLRWFWEMNEQSTMMFKKIWGRVSKLKISKRITRMFYI